MCLKGSTAKSTVPQDRQKLVTQAVYTH